MTGLWVLYALGPDDACDWQDADGAPRQRPALVLAQRGTETQLELEVHCSPQFDRPHEGPVLYRVSVNREDSGEVPGTWRPTGPDAIWLGRGAQPPVEVESGRIVLVSR